MLAISFLTLNTVSFINLNIMNGHRDVDDDGSFTQIISPLCDRSLRSTKLAINAHEESSPVLVLWRYVLWLEDPLNQNEFRFANNELWYGFDKSFRCQIQQSSHCYCGGVFSYRHIFFRWVANRVGRIRMVFFSNCAGKLCYSN